VHSVHALLAAVATAGVAANDDDDGIAVFRFPPGAPPADDEEVDEPEEGFSEGGGAEMGIGTAFFRPS
jgi:hypothetical protein